VDDARVLADADEQVLAHLVGGLLAELAQVRLAALVRAVLGPHDGVHRQLGGGGPPAEDVADPLVLVGLEAELGVRLLEVGRGRLVLHGVVVLVAGARRGGGHRFPRWRGLRGDRGAAARGGRGQDIRAAGARRRAVHAAGTRTPPTVAAATGP